MSKIKDKRPTKNEPLKIFGDALDYALPERRQKALNKNLVRSLYLSHLKSRNDVTYDELWERIRKLDKLHQANEIPVWKVVIEADGKTETVLMCNGAGRNPIFNEIFSIEVNVPVIHDIGDSELGFNIISYDLADVEKNIFCVEVHETYSKKVYVKAMDWDDAFDVVSGMEINMDGSNYMQDTTEYLKEKEVTAGDVSFIMEFYDSRYGKYHLLNEEGKRLAWENAIENFENPQK